jgi:hypothetical protein
MRTSGSYDMQRYLRPDQEPLLGINKSEIAWNPSDTPRWSRIPVWRNARCQNQRRLPIISLRQESLVLWLYTVYGLQQSYYAFRPQVQILQLASTQAAIQLRENVQVNHISFSYSHLNVRLVCVYVGPWRYTWNEWEIQKTFKPEGLKGSGLTADGRIILKRILKK